MISLEEVEKSILELENKDTSYAVCEKLSWLYTVRDHIKPSVQEDIKYTDSFSGNDFMSAVSHVDINKLIPILSEHMEVVKILYPNEYNSVLRRINEIKKID